MTRASGRWVSLGVHMPACSIQAPARVPKQVLRTVSRRQSLDCRLLLPLVEWHCLLYTCFVSDPCGGLQVFGEAVRDDGGLHTEETQKPALEAGL